MERIIGIIGILYVFLVIVIVNSAKNFMKRKKVSAGTNKTLTWVVSFVASFALMGALTFVLMRSISNGEFAKFENPEVETYEHMGYTFEVYHDELPVEIADLLDTDYEKYSTRWRVQETPFLAEYDAEQSPRMQDIVEQPTLKYTIVKVKMPALYDMCFKELYHKYEDSPYNQQLPESERRRYVEVDATPWKAKEAYRVYSGEDAWNQYLICWDDYMVVFCPEWELTEEQMQIVAERLQRL